MEQGFIVDCTEGGKVVSHWLAGKPEFGYFGGLKTRERVQHPVTTFRCQKCGYLESYALASEASR